MNQYVVAISLAVAAAVALARVYPPRSWFSKRTLWLFQYGIVRALMLLQKTLPPTYRRLRNLGRGIKGAFIYLLTHFLTLIVSGLLFLGGASIGLLHESSFRAEWETMQKNTTPLKIDQAYLPAPHRNPQQLSVATTPSNALPASTSVPPYEPGEVNVWTLALLVLAVLAIVTLVILWVEILFDSRPKTDEPAFRDALAEWNVLLAKKLETVRELKRFENQARFLVLALRADARDMGGLARWHETCCRELGQATPYPTRPPTLSDKIVIGLTAWLYCGGNVDVLRSGDLENIIDMTRRLDAKLTSDLQEHHKDHGAPAFRDAVKTLAALYWGTPT